MRAITSPPVADKVPVTGSSRTTHVTAVPAWSLPAISDIRNILLSNVVQLTTTVSGSDSWDEAKPGDNKFLAVAGYIVIRSAAKRDGRLGRETLIK